MAPLLTRSQFIARSINLIGRDYIYGGRSPDVGFDCWGAYPAAFTLGGDLETAKRLHSWFTGEAWFQLPPKPTDKPPRVMSHEELLPGDAVFYGPGPAKHPTDVYAQVNHVAIWVGHGVVLSASGGDKDVVSQAIARARKAFFRAHSSWLYRSDVVGFRSMAEFFRP